jgi:hypothetical protein
MYFVVNQGVNYLDYKTYISLLGSEHHVKNVECRLIVLYSLMACVAPKDYKM